jgi:8-oxo-dGTP diphosphatase
MDDRWPGWWPEKKLGAAAAIFDEHGKVLLVKHSYGRLNWELPGGAVEVGEGVVEAAVREVHEETGLRVIPQHLTGVYFDVDAEALHFVFCCRRQDTAAVPRPDADEVTECEFWNPGELPRPISDFTGRRVEDAVSGTEQPLPATVRARQWLEY